MRLSYCRAAAHRCLACLQPQDQQASPSEQEHGGYDSNGSAQGLLDARNQCHTSLYAVEIPALFIHLFLQLRPLGIDPLTFALRLH